MLGQQLISLGERNECGIVCECVYRGVMFAHSTQGSVWYLSHVSPSVMRTQGPVKRSLSIHSLMSPFVQLFSLSESEDPLDTEHILSSWDCNWSKWGWHEEREREREWERSGWVGECDCCLSRLIDSLWMPITITAKRKSWAVIGRLLCVFSIADMSVDLWLDRLLTICSVPVKQGDSLND